MWCMCSELGGLRRGVEVLPRQAGDSLRGGKHVTPFLFWMLADALVFVLERPLRVDQGYVSRVFLRVCRTLSCGACVCGAVDSFAYNARRSK